MKRINYKELSFINGLQFIKETNGKVISNRVFRTATFKCYCGNDFETLISSVVTKNTKSCGCLGIKSRKDRFTKHGLRNHPIYDIWRGIKTRCYNKNRDDYKYYGGNGIELSDEFKDFKCFYDYLISLPFYDKREEKKLTIGRINVCKNYERGNLRWATRKEQSLNQRRNTLRF